MLRLSVVIVAGLLANGCGGTGAVRTAPDQSQPRISWEVRTGGADGDDRTVCRSTDATPTCTLTAGTMVMLRLLFHPAERQTNYLGAWRAPFLQGWTERDYRDVVGTVQPGETPFRKAVNGLVTDKPGTYGFNVLLDAAQEGIPAGHRIVVNAPVVVTAAGATSPTQPTAYREP
jgi:hypothetical protein